MLVANILASYFSCRATAGYTFDHQRLSVMHGEKLGGQAHACEDNALKTSLLRYYLVRANHGVTNAHVTVTPTAPHAFQSWCGNHLTALFERVTTTSSVLIVSFFLASLLLSRTLFAFTAFHGRASLVYKFVRCQTRVALVCSVFTFHYVRVLNNFGHHFQITFSVFIHVIHLIFGQHLTALEDR